MSRRLRYAGVVLLVGAGAIFAIIRIVGGATLAFGSLGPPPPQGNLCLPAQRTQAVVGTYVLRNQGPGDIRIEQVRLVDAESLRLVSSFLAPVLIVKGNHEVIGALPETPRSGSDAYTAWRQRVPAKSANIHVQEDRNLVLVLDAAGGGKHTAKDVEVVYRDDDGKRFRYLAAMTIQIQPHAEPCA